MARSRRLPFGHGWVLTGVLAAGERPDTPARFP